MTDPQELALLANIREHHYRELLSGQPLSDEPRLVYADWLDERAGYAIAPCDVCSPYLEGHTHETYRGRFFDLNPFETKYGYHPERDPASGRYEGGWTNCKKCNAGGSTPYIGKPGFISASNGYADRAELIRAQCELATMSSECHNSLCDGSLVVCKQCREYKSLKRTELELLREYYSVWMNALPDRIRLDSVRQPTSPPAKFHRGFPSILTMKLSDWVGEECEACEGCGGTREWNEGLLLYNHHKCGDCRGIGRVNALGPKIVTAVPVERVTITDHCPADRTSSNGNWYWSREIPHGERTQHHLPDFVFFLLKGKIEFDLIGIPFDSANAANAALSLAAIRWAFGEKSGQAENIKDNEP